MDIQFYGANCIVVTTKQIRIVIDDNLESLGAKSVIREGDVCLFTYPHDPVPKAKMTIDLPGEYEISGVSIKGIQARAHMDGDSERNAVMYKITNNDTKILVVGHIYPKISESKLEDIGLVDVMLTPVGGNGFTLDPVGALQVIKQIEPKIVVPTHYDDSSLAYEVPQQQLAAALTAIGIDPKETTKKLQFKSVEATDTTQLVVVERS